METLTGFPRLEVATQILARYSVLTPEVRTEAVTRLLRHTDWLQSVFDAIADGKISKARIAHHCRDMYMQHGNKKIREQAISLFGKDWPGPRSDVVAQYQAALKLPSDRDRGVAVLKRDCLDCHLLRNEGHEVGPNLVTEPQVDRRETMTIMRIIDAAWKPAALEDLFGPPTRSDE